MVTCDPDIISARSAQFGKFATTSRLIATLVSESLIPAYFFKSDMLGSDESTESISNSVGICLMPLFPMKLNDPKPFQLGSVYAIVPLRGLPVLKRPLITGSLNDIQCYEVDILHAWDMLPHIYGPAPSDDSAKSSHEPVTTNRALNGSDMIHRLVKKFVSKIFGQETGQDCLLSDGCDAADFWKRFIQTYKYEIRAKVIAQGLDTAMAHQVYQYNHPKPLPTLKSSPVEWEQALIEGHPFIPMSRYPSSTMQDLTPDKFSSNFERPRVRLVAIPRDSMNIYGNFEDIIAPVVKAILQENSEKLQKEYSASFLMPVHHMQIANIQKKIPEAVILPEELYVEGYGLSSIRSIAIPGVLDNATLKLTFGFTMGGKMRTLTPGRIRTALDFTQRVLPSISYNRDVLTIQPEAAAACYKHQDSDIAMHCSCIVREAMEYKINPESDDIFIVVAALVEKIRSYDTDESLMTHVWKLDTEEKRAQFLDRHIELYLQAVIPVCRDNGMAFEAHGQNTLARFDQNGELKGFVFRDIDNVIAHPETVKKSCGIDLIPHEINWAHSIEDVYRFLYFMSFDTYLTSVIDAMGMYQNGRGWQMVRIHLSKLLPPDHSMYKYFFEQEEIPSFCYIRAMMEIDGGYRLKPNLLFSNPKGQDI